MHRSSFATLDAVARRSRGLAGAAALALAASCGDAVGLIVPAPRPLLVTNASCASGTCTPIRVLVFPSNQPKTPGGAWSLDLGVVDSPSACLTIPASATFKVIDGGTGRTTAISWTTYDDASIGIVTAAQSLIQASSSTGAFVPAKSAGWSVALPGSATPVPAAACE